jgi:hypothetical protein
VLPLFLLLWLCRHAPLTVAKASTWRLLHAMTAIVTAFSLVDWLNRLGYGAPGRQALDIFALSWRFEGASYSFQALALFLSATALLVMLALPYFNEFERDGSIASRESTPPRARWWSVGLRAAWALPWASVAASCLALRADYHLREQLPEWLLAPRNFFDPDEVHSLAEALRSGPVIREFLEHAATNNAALSIATALAMMAMLFVISWRGSIFAVCCFAFIARFYAEAPQELQILLNCQLGRQLAPYVQNLKALQRIPWWVLLVLAASCGTLLVARLVRKLAPGEAAVPAGRALSLAVVVIALAIPHAPIGFSLALVGGVIFGILGWSLTRAARPLVTRLDDWLQLSRWQWFAALGVVLLFVWPTPKGSEPLVFWQLGTLWQQLRELLGIALAGLFVLLLHRYSKELDLAKPEDTDAVVLAGATIFAALVNRSYGTWLFVVPVPLLTAWLVARYALLGRAPESPGTLHLTPEERQVQIRRALAGVKAQAAFRAAERALDKKLEGAELTPEEYRTKLDEYRRHRDTALSASNIGPKRGMQPFATTEDQRWETGSRFARVGATLAAVPLIITLYQYLPEREIAFPYPALDLVTLLASSVTSWLLIAFFFGYFFAEIRGRNGVEKGFVLFAALLAPALILPILNAAPMANLAPFAIWSTQVLAYCILLGGYEDYRTLRAADFTLRDLVTMLELPWLSVYASSVVAALVTGVVGLLNKQVGEAAKLFLDAFGGGAGH